MGENDPAADVARISSGSVETVHCRAGRGGSRSGGGAADVQVAAAIALSLFFAARAIATVVAMLLPRAFDRLGELAFGSGPLATVIQDLLSILVYTGVASVVVG